MIKSAKSTGMATRNRQKQPLRERVSFSLPKPQITLTHVLFFSFLCMVMVVAYGSMHAIDKVLTVPVEQVQVAGELHFQQQQEIARLINRHVEGGFVRVDLERLQKELVALPWVYRASIKRQLPNGLLITVEEEQAAAYWNENALINIYGEVFTPATRPQIDGLPMLSGVNHALVLQVYQQLQTVLPEAQKPLRALQVSGQKTVLVSLSNQTQLVMKQQQLEEQIAHWLTISTTLSAEHLAAIKKVDLRYSNGAAVEWHEPIAGLMNNKRGGHH